MGNSYIEAHMSEHSEVGTRRRLVAPMRARSADEHHRAATPLELFFDLVFVVAVAQASAGLHHAIAEGHVGEGILYYGMVFFAIWWAWMNFTWFASAYDNDDVVYRLLTFVQMVGALMLAAGVPAVFEGSRFVLITAGYTVMRLAMVTQWLRAARGDPSHRSTAQRYALGIGLLQVLWIAQLALPDSWKLPVFVLLVLLELTVPIWAEQSRVTTWHAGHIAERYGLFTIIVLGELILSSSLAIQSAVQAGEFNNQLLEIVAGGMLIVFSIWWLYFDRPAEDMLRSLLVAFTWGYGHLLLFAAVAAVGSGLAVAIDRATDHAEISPFGAGMAVAVPVALYLVALLLMHLRRDEHHWRAILTIITALLVLLTPFTGHAVMLIGVLMVVLVAIKLATHEQGGAPVEA